jgi:hypothetical protein
LIDFLKRVESYEEIASIVGNEKENDVLVAFDASSCEDGTNQVIQDIE